MKHIKLLDGLRILDKEEWISFRKYLLMYCTKASDHYKLLDYLSSIRVQLLEISSLDQIKQPLFDEMTKKAFSNLMSRVFNWYEEWLIWNENKKNVISKDVQLVKIYNRRGAFTLADKTYKRVEKVLLDEKQLDLETHRHLYLLQHYHYFSDNPVKYQRKKEILETLMTYFLFQFKEQALLYITELHNWGNIQNHDYEMEIELLTQISLLINDSKTSEVIQVIQKLVSEMDAQSFLDLRDIIASDQLKKDSELYMLASLYMVSFSLRLWNANKISDPQLVYNAYDFGLETGILLNTGKIPFIRFMNLVTTLGYIRTSDKTYAFIDKWFALVDSENHDAVKALSYAQLRFIEGKYDDLIPLLLGNKYETDLGRLRSSALELVGLYTDRKNNYSILVNRIRNFKRVLNTYGSKQKNLSFRIYVNFVKVLDLLVKRDFVKMSINIESYSPIIFKMWLEKEIKAGQK